MVEIIGRSETKLTCSQYALGEEHYYIDATLKLLIESGNYQVLGWNTDLVAGDLLFYGDLFNNPSHVSKVDETGLPISKFTDDPNIYRHGMWDEPIPENMNYETCLILRSLIR